VYFYYILLDKNGERKEDKQAIKRAGASPAIGS
jgi:hypothetical protein